MSTGFGVLMADIGCHHPRRSYSVERGPPYNYRAFELKKSNVVFVAKSAGREAPAALRTRPPALDAMQLSVIC